MNTSLTLTKEERMRHLIEMALNSGRKRISPQTGFIHYCYQSPEDATPQTIPILENFLFALTLLRTKTSENILEGRQLLENLLAFQCQIEGDAKGNFPVYLHEYPQCRDRFLAINLLPIIFWISKQFSSILGSELNRKFEAMTRFLLDFCVHLPENISLPEAAKIKLGAALKALGILRQDNALEKEGDALLSKCLEDMDPASWVETSQLADRCIALQLIYPSISASPWGRFWEFLKETWDHTTCSYIGPAVREFQCREEPRVNLYDLFLGYFSGNWSRRARLDSIVHLQGALIQPSDDFISSQMSTELKGAYKGQQWMLIQTQAFSWTAIEKNETPGAVDEKGFNPFRIIWGDATRAHTFACQNGNAKRITFSRVDSGIDLFFTLGNMVNVDDKERSREVSFFFDYMEDTQIMVDDIPATTFRLGDKVEIISPGLKLSMTFHIERGDGHFFGHLMRSNRPSQLAVKGNNRWQAYDWELFLRTLRRTEDCCVCVQIRWSEK